MKKLEKLYFLCFFSLLYLNYLIPYYLKNNDDSKHLSFNSIISQNKIYFSKPFENNENLCNIAVITQWSKTSIEEKLFFKNFDPFFNVNSSVNSRYNLNIISIERDAKIFLNDSLIKTFYITENMDEYYILENMEILLNFINQNKYPYVLFMQSIEVNLINWMLVSICQKIVEKSKIIFYLNFPLNHEVSLENIGFIRKIEETANFLIVKNYFYHHTLVHSYGVDEEKIIIMDKSLNENMFIELVKSGKNNIKSYNFGSGIDINSLLNNKLIKRYCDIDVTMFCLYADFNTQINILINKRAEILRIGLVNKNTYVIVDRITGIDKFTINNNLNPNYLNIDHDKQLLAFESINIRLKVKIKENKISIGIYKIDQLSFSLGLCGTKMIKLLQINKFQPIELSYWKIKDNDIFTHFSEGQTKILFGDRINIYKQLVELKSIKLVDFEIQGPVFSHNSFANVNRNMFLAIFKVTNIRVLLNPDEDHLLENDSDLDTLIVFSMYRYQLISEIRKENRNLKKLVFRNGHSIALKKDLVKEAFLLNNYILILQQPWEFDAVPLDWLPYFTNKLVKEMWVPSEYNRKSYITNGIDSNKIKVIPHGIFLEKFNFNHKKFNLSDKKFKFLTIGGLIKRKGLDLILNAFTATFSNKDNVSLIIQTFNADKKFSNYFLKDLERIKSNKSSPEIIFRSSTKSKMSYPEIIKLYKSADVYVSPYRSEGFGLTILEAMASGLPAIVSGYGPALEFCSKECCYFVEAKETDCSYFPCGKMSIFGLKTSFQPKWSEPSIDSLISKMKESYKNSNVLKKKSKSCKNEVKNYTWDQITIKMKARIRELTNIYFL